jgi:hypothetical protein
MENIYLKSSKEGQLNYLNPKKETIQFLLNYSKALIITDYKMMKFEALLN